MKYKWNKDNRPNPNESQHDKKNKEWYVKRNKQLLADKQIHTYRELEDMYGVGRDRLVKLVANESKKFWNEEK